MVYLSSRNIASPSRWRHPDGDLQATHRDKGARLEGQLYDVAVATTRDKPGLDNGVRVLRVERETGEAHLSFLQGADGAGSYFLSLICPAGLIARQTAAVPAELDGTWWPSCARR